MPTTAPTISSRTITSTTAITPVTEPRSLEDPLCAAVTTPGSLVVVVLSLVEGSVGPGGVDIGLPVEVVVETVDMSPTLVELSVVPSVVLSVVPSVAVVLSVVLSVVPSVALSVVLAAGVVLLGVILGPLEQSSVREILSKRILYSTTDQVTYHHLDQW